MRRSLSQTCPANGRCTAPRAIAVGGDVVGARVEVAAGAVTENQSSQVHDGGRWQLDAEVRLDCAARYCSLCRAIRAAPERSIIRHVHVERRRPPAAMMSTCAALLDGSEVIRGFAVAQAETGTLAADIPSLAAIAGGPNKAGHDGGIISGTRPSRCEPHGRDAEAVGGCTPARGTWAVHVHALGTGSGGCRRSGQCRGRADARAEEAAGGRSTICRRTCSGGSCCSSWTTSSR
jgi:hypothetical protein